MYTYCAYITRALMYRYVYDMYLQRFVYAPGRRISKLISGRLLDPTTANARPRARYRQFALWAYSVAVTNANPKNVEYRKTRASKSIGLRKNMFARRSNINLHTIGPCATMQCSVVGLRTRNFGGGSPAMTFF